MSQSSSKVNMSLDDIIKQRRAENHRGRGGRINIDDGMNKGRNKRRNFGERRRYEKQDLPAENYLKKNQEKRTRLFISNLQKEVINSELRKIFSDCGELKRCGIHWDKMGYSLGMADVEFEKPEDAKKAIDKFDNAEIEGTAMRVEYGRSNRNFAKIHKRRGTFERRREIIASGRRGGRRKVVGRRQNIGNE